MTDRPTLTWPGTGEVIPWHGDGLAQGCAGMVTVTRVVDCDGGDVTWVADCPLSDGDAEDLTPQGALGTLYAAMVERHTARGAFLGVRSAEEERAGGYRDAMARLLKVMKVEQRDIQSARAYVHAEWRKTVVGVLRETRAVLRRELAAIERGESAGATPAVAKTVTTGVDDYEPACTCHLGNSAPCSYCAREWECTCDGNHVDGHDVGCDHDGEVSGAVRSAEAPQSAMHARHKIDEAIHRLYEERAKVLDADDARGDVSEYTTSLAEVIDYFEAAEAHMKYSSEDLVAHGNACRAVERSRIEQALRPNGACIWCKREDGHGEECVVAAAVKGEVSGG